MKFTLLKNRDLNNVVYSVLSYVITPVILIVSTPLLLDNLGGSRYGIWVLINSLINVLGISNFGLGNAFIKIGSEYEASKDQLGFNQLFTVSFTLSIILAIAISLSTYLFGGYIFPVFFDNTGIEEMMPVAHLVGGIVGLRIINSVISGSYMARQRYDLNSKISIGFNLFTSIIFTILAILFKDIQVLVLSLFISTIALLLINIFIAKHNNPQLVFKLAIRKPTLQKIIGYGIYSWLQLIISAINSQADKLIVGGLLGPAALGYYSVCMQLVAKIHEIPTAAAAFLVPKFSTLYELRDGENIRSVYSKAMLYKSIFIIASGILAFILAPQILGIWIGSDFAGKHADLFRLLTIATSIGAFGVIPYYCLNGTGFVRFNTIISLATSGSSIILLFLLAPQFGDIGIGLSKLVSIPLVIVSIYVIRNKVFRRNAAGEETDAQMNGLNVKAQ